MIATCDAFMWDSPCHSHHRDSGMILWPPFLGFHGMVTMAARVNPRWTSNPQKKFSSELDRKNPHLDIWSEWVSQYGDWDMSWYVNDVHDVNGSNVTTTRFFLDANLASPVVLAKAFDAKIHGIYRSLTPAKAWHRLLSRRSSSGQPLEDYWRCVTWWRLILIWSIGISIAIGL